jgi:methylglutaconyl-CoA hydratase
VVPAEALDGAVEAEIRPYFAASPEAVAAAKALAHALAPPIDEKLIEMTLMRLADTWETPQAAEGIAAFLEKRKAGWVLADR